VEQASHDDPTGFTRAPELLQLGPGKPLALLDGAGMIGDGDLEHVLGQVDCDRYRGHGMGSFPLELLGVWRFRKYSFGRSPSHSLQHRRAGRADATQPEICR
jgi:hypothetical protein